MGDGNQSHSPNSVITHKKLINTQQHFHKESLQRPAHVCSCSTHTHTHTPIHSRPRLTSSQNKRSVFDNEINFALIAVKNDKKSRYKRVDIIIVGRFEGEERERVDEGKDWFLQCCRHILPFYQSHWDIVSSCVRTHLSSQLQMWHEHDKSA